MLRILQISWHDTYKEILLIKKTKVVKICIYYVKYVSTVGKNNVILMHWNYTLLFKKYLKLRGVMQNFETLREKSKLPKL